MKENSMKPSYVLSAALVAAAVAFTSHIVLAQGTGLARTDLIQRDISIEGHEAVQVRVDFEPGAASINHSHPGEEIAYVLAGSLEYHLEGRGVVTLNAGESLFIPAGVAHVAKNVGNSRASELATYIVKKGAPLVAPAK